jgi:hypothetical protein
MGRNIRTLSILAGVALAVAACEQVKSANPLSPAIAGPIAGVTISAPTLMTPANGAQVAVNAQPVVLSVQNAETTGVRPLSYAFQIAADASFASPLFTQNGVAPGADGRTSLRLTQNLAPEHTYFWRAKAEDGANTSDFSEPLRFQVYTPVILGIPELLTPEDGATLTTTAVKLEVKNASVSGPVVGLQYLFEVAPDASLANRVVAVEVTPGSGTTSYTTQPLAPQTRFFWRVRAFDASHTGDPSPIRSFVTGGSTAAPPPSGGGGSNGPAPNDAIDLRDVTFAKGENITDWAVTSTVLSAAHSGGDLCIDHTKAGHWPALPWFDDPDTLVEGNQWVFVKLDGRWVGGADEWLRPGQTCKGMQGHVGEGAFGGTILEKWTPSPGELMGVAVSTPARAGQWGTAERSNIVLIHW